MRVPVRRLVREFLRYWRASPLFVWCLVVLWTGTSSGRASASELPPLPVYDEQLQSNFSDRSFAEHDLAEQLVVRSGARAIRFKPSRGGGLYFYKSRIVRVSEYDTLEFWVHGGSGGGQRVNLILQSGGKAIYSSSLGDWLPEGTLRAGQWQQVRVNLGALSLPDGIFDGILLRDASLGEQPSLYVDDMRLVPRYVPPPKLTDVGLSQYQLVLAANDTASLKLTASFEDGSTADRSEAAVWTSSDPSVLGVEGGRLTARRQGVAKVSATLERFTISAWAQVADTLPWPVYEDGLTSGFLNWSWGTINMASTAQVHGGQVAISFRAKGYEGLWFRRAVPEDAREYYGLQLSVYGGTGGQRLKVLLMKDRSSVGEVLLAPLPAATWATYRLKLADMGLAGELFDGLIVQAWGQEDQGTIFVDDIALLRNLAPVGLPPPELPRVQVSVDVTADRRPVSPDLFGVNYEDMPTAGYSQLAFPVKRWGGNSMTRYNWELDAVSRGSDWYFLSLPYSGTDASRLPVGSRADRFISESLARGTKVLLQVPTLGWVPKDREVRWSFSVAKYGAQAGTECDWSATSHCDAGNGLLPETRAYLTGNDPEDASRRVGPEFVARWLEHLQGQFGAGAVRYYALDNEPALWPHTHRDVHPEPTTYDEVWDYTRRYATLLKQLQPYAKVFGPVAWGWCEYFFSAKDGCARGQDMDAHGGKPFLEWYLGKVREHEQATGVRLVDYLDVHYYPAERSIAFTSDESAETSRRRLLALRSLYDRNYRNPTSWIQTPVYLIPRMRELIERTAPGTKLAITEYNFGDGTGIGSGLAQAEALALFAREGVDVATRWGALLANTPLEDAFKLYLNYDGLGGRITGDSVRAVSSNVDVVGAYAFQSAGGTTFLLLFNKDIAPRTVELAPGSLTEGAASVYRFDARQQLSRVQDLEHSSGPTTLTLPARSATLLVR